MKFSTFVKKQMQEAIHHLTFIIRRFHGFCERLYRQTATILSMSPIPLLDDLARLFRIEQSYQMLSILNHLLYYHA